MPDKNNAPYGSWQSPITSDLIVAGTVGLGQVRLDGEAVYWIEQRPTEGGRNVIVRRTPDGTIADLTPRPFNARTRVHEYGGGAYAVRDGALYFSNFTDQRLYRQTGAAEPKPLTAADGLRYADAVVDTQRSRLICVREDHRLAGQEAVNSLVSIDLASGEETVIVSGSDFYSNPRLNPGRHPARLAGVEPSADALGRHRAVGRDAPLGRVPGGRQAGSWRRRGVHFSARMVSARYLILCFGSFRLVESVPGAQRQR